MRTFIIAEAGVNHNGELDTAFHLIDVAVRAGADAIKFQTFKAERVVMATAETAQYQRDNTGRDETQMEMLRRLELPEDAFAKLFSYCSELGIMFMSTPFDEESADMLDRLGMSIFKIPSGEITNKALIQHIASKNRPVLLSTGMSYLGEVEKAILWIQEIWAALERKPLLNLLHCTSNYPASADDVNLRGMKTMEAAFGLPVGYSDHSMGIEIPIAAVAMGASVIEKHFTIDRSMKGPDHKASLEPGELEAMIKAIRNIEKAMGDGKKKPIGREEALRIGARRSLVAKRDMEADHIVSPDDIAIKRPGSGIAPEHREKIIGMQVKRRVLRDSLIRWEDMKSA